MRCSKVFARLTPWFIWGVAAFFVFYQFLIQASPSVMYAQLMRDLSIDVTQVGILSSIYYYTYVVLQMPAGMLVDRWGARRLLMVGSCAFAICCAIFALTTSYEVASLSRLAMGIVASPGIVGSLFLVRRWFKPEQFAFVVGMTEMIGMMGAAIGEPLLSHAVHEWGWQIAMLGCAAFGGVLAFCTWGWVQDSPNPENNSLPCASIPTVTCAPIRQTLRKIMGMPIIWGVGLYSGLLFAILNSFGALWGVPYLQERYHISNHTATTLTAMVFLGASLGAPVIGWLAEKVGKRKPIMSICALITALLMIFAIYITAIPQILMYVLLFLIGFISTSYMLPFAVVCDLIEKPMHAAAMGFINMLSIIIGGPVLQPVIGWILGLHTPIAFKQNVPYYSVDAFHTAFIPLLIAVILAFVLNLLIPEVQCRDETQL